MKCYLFDAALGRTIEAAEAIEMDCSEALSEWDGLSNVSGSFFGVIGPHDQTLQFMWEDDEHVTIDVPLPEKGGSLTKQSDYEECREAIERVFAREDPTAIQGLRFVSWR